MQNMFKTADRVEIERRLAALQPSCPRQWGKMTAAQMLAHCAAALEVPLGERQARQGFLGRHLTPFMLSSILSEQPLGRNVPTDVEELVVDEREFSQEQRRLVDVLTRFCDRGTAAADGKIHSVMGRLTGQQWGRFVYKHLDHHLRQFGG